MALEPDLTPLDAAVLAAVRRSRSLRAEQVRERAEALAEQAWTAHDAGWGRWRWRPEADRRADVRGILRGLEHRGLVSGRGGWWRRTDTPGTAG